MNVLTNDNKSFDINMLSEHDEDIRYSVLDYSDENDVDYYFLPLVFLDNFTRPAAALQIGKYKIQMPLDWSVVIVDKHTGTTEAIELKSINGRDFDVWCFNPINGFSPDFERISITNIYPDVEWFMPKLKNGHILVVPLETGDKPKCALFVKDINKLPDQLDVSTLI